MVRPAPPAMHAMSRGWWTKPKSRAGARASNNLSREDFGPRTAASVAGGRMVLAAWGPIERSPGFAVLAAAVARHIGAAPAVAARSPFSLPDTGELRDLMDGAGLRVVTV